MYVIRSVDWLVSSLVAGSFSVFFESSLFFEFSSVSLSSVFSVLSGRWIGGRIIGEVVCTFSCVVSSFSEFVGRSVLELGAALPADLPREFRFPEFAEISIEFWIF